MLLTKEEAHKYFSDEPWSLIEKGLEFTLAGLGRARLIDTVAAGGLWAVFEILESKYTGKKIACYVNWGMEDKDEIMFQYVANANDDGFLFNNDPKTITNNEHNWGGDFIQKIDGMFFWFI